MCKWVWPSTCWSGHLSSQYLGSIRWNLKMLLVGYSLVLYTQPECLVRPFFNQTNSLRRVYKPFTRKIKLYPLIQHIIAFTSSCSNCSQCRHAQFMRIHFIPRLFNSGILDITKYCNCMVNASSVLKIWCLCSILVSISIFTRVHLPEVSQFEANGEEIFQPLVPAERYAPPNSFPKE